jgi:hypothetical protein
MVWVHVPEYPMVAVAVKKKLFNLITPSTMDTLTFGKNIFKTQHDFNSYTNG